MIHSSSFCLSSFINSLHIFHNYPVLFIFHLFILDQNQSVGDSPSDVVKAEKSTRTHPFPTTRLPRFNTRKSPMTPTACQIYLRVAHICHSSCLIQRDRKEKKEGRKTKGNRKERRETTKRDNADDKCCFFIGRMTVVLIIIVFIFFIIKNVSPDP